MYVCEVIKNKSNELSRTKQVDRVAQERTY